MSETNHGNGRAGGDQPQARVLDLLAILLDRVVPYALLLGIVALLPRAGGEADSPWLALLGSRAVTRGAAFVFGLAGVLYGLQQRNLRRNESRRLARRIAELELRSGS